MPNQDPGKIRWRAAWRDPASRGRVWWQKRPLQHGETRLSLGAAQQDADEAVANGHKCVQIQRDSGGTDHPDNAGKFFLYRIVN